MRFARSSLWQGLLSPHRRADGKRSSEANDSCVRTAGQISPDILAPFSREYCYSCKRILCFVHRKKHLKATSYSREIEWLYRKPCYLVLGPSQRYRRLRRSMRSAIRVALTHSLDQRAPRIRHDRRERTYLLGPVVLEAQARPPEPRCSACIRRIQALRI